MLNLRSSSTKFIILLLIFTSFISKAALIGVNPTEPKFIFYQDITLPSNTSITYISNSGSFKVSANPIIFNPSSNSYISIVDTGSQGPKKLSINIQVDNEGNLITGNANHDLILQGKISFDGADYDDTLLTGEILEFGYYNGVNTDSYDFVFEITGGSLANEYLDKDIGITLVSESSSFNGKFDENFSGQAKGYLGATDQFTNFGIPGIAICKLVSINGTDYLDADNISGDLCDDYPQTIPAGDLSQLDVTYKLVIINKGNQALTNIKISDLTLGLVDVEVPRVLGIGETFTITQGSVNFNALYKENRCEGTPGIKSNVASVIATGVENSIPVSDSDPAAVNCTSSPDISLRKEVSVDGGLNFSDANSLNSSLFTTLNSAIEYRLIIKNTGNATLTNIEITDNRLQIDQWLLMTDTNTELSLEPGQEIVINKGTTEITNSQLTEQCRAIGNIVNIASVNATEFGTSNVVSSSDPANVKCETPEIIIKKEVSVDGINFFDANSATAPDVPTGMNGESVFYRITVTNIGSVILTEVKINDAILGIIDHPINNLAPGEQSVITEIENGESNFLENVDLCTSIGTHYNIASVKASAEIGENEYSVEGDDPAHVKCIAGPAIELIKLVSIDNVNFFDADFENGDDTPTTELGKDIYYKFVIRNVGAIPLENIILEDITLGILGYELDDITLNPGEETELFSGVIQGSESDNRQCDVVGNHYNIAKITAIGVDTSIYVEDTNPANVNCIELALCSLNVDKQCAVVNIPSSGDLLCEAKIKATTLRYTGPTLENATVIFEGKDGGQATYNNVDLISGVTILTSPEQNGFTVDSANSLGSKTNITINGTLEIIHTSCSAIYEAGLPAPLDGNTPNPSNSDKGDPSPNWHVVNFADKEGGYVTELPGEPGLIGDNCTAITNNSIDVIHYYTVTNTGNSAILLTTLFDSKLGNLLSESTAIAIGDTASFQETSTISSSATHSVIASANIAGVNSSTCQAEDISNITITPPQEPVSCKSIKDINLLSMVWNGPDGVDIETENGQLFSNVMSGNKISFDVLENDTDLFISGAITGQSRFHKSCSDKQMKGNEHCGLAQGDGKDNDESLLNLFLLDGMTGDKGSFNCALPNTGVIEPVNGGGNTGQITAKSTLEVKDKNIKWELTNNSNTDFSITDITIVWPLQHKNIEKIKLEKDFAKGHSLKSFFSPTILDVSNFEHDVKKRTLKKGKKKKLEIKFKDKFKANKATDFFISVTFDNGQTLTIGTP